eukprot:TRINITY_DN7698_c0_g1_i2.p1 TRINITY_DN7698_c0_g1~~TRINITY_DN7698_c0_g1_i2.p1  ORF type:complete len:381 (+),score=135.38 TRINITY_DN7698_c0_g1_i2:38-1180(+)
MSSGRDRSKDREEEPPRPLKEREIINIFMACGILEHIAKDIFRACPELKDLTDKNGEDFKGVIREALNLLDKEGVPKIVIEEPKDGAPPSRTKVALCRICSDNAALRARFPEKMAKWFRINQSFKGRLRKEDWLCKGCYGEWYRANREWLETEGNQAEDDKADANESEDESAEDAKAKAPKKEYYLKTIVNLLCLTVKNLAPAALIHRKMLIRYITLDQLELNQLATALNYLRKAGSGVIDQEDFEKACGIGQYSDLFGFSSWKEEHSQREILRIGEAERLKRKKEKQAKREQDEREAKQREAEERRELERKKQLQDQLEKAEREAFEKARAEKLKKLTDTRKKEDEDIAEARKKADALKLKQKEKKEADKRVACPVLED